MMMIDNSAIVKKVKKQMTREIAFFDDTMAYFSKLTESKGKVEDSSMLKKLSIMLQKRKIRRVCLSLLTVRYSTV
jgi:hypothetical protein